MTVRTAPARASRRGVYRRPTRLYWTPPHRRIAPLSATIPGQTLDLASSTAPTQPGVELDVDTSQTLDLPSVIDGHGFGEGGFGEGLFGYGIDQPGVNVGGGTIAGIYYSPDGANWVEVGAVDVTTGTPDGMYFCPDGVNWVLLATLSLV